jgi:hypothetical protein
MPLIQTTGRDLANELGNNLEAMFGDNPTPLPY